MTQSLAQRSDFFTWRSICESFFSHSAEKAMNITYTHVNQYIQAYKRTHARTFFSLAIGNEKSHNDVRKGL